MYEGYADQSTIDSASVPTSDGVFEPGTSTDRKRSSTRINTRVLVKSRFSETSTSESDDFNSDRDYTPRGSGKSKKKSKRSATTPAVSRAGMLARMRRRIKEMVSSSSESDGREKRRIYESTSVSPESEKRRYSSSWSDSSPERRNKRPKTKGKSKSTLSEVANTIKVRKDLIKKEDWYAEDRTGSDASQRSAGISEYRSHRVKKRESRRYRSIKESDSDLESRRGESDETRSPKNDETSKATFPETKIKADYSTTDSERNLSNVRSSSQCSVRSSKIHVSKKKSKHKDRRREKGSHRSNGKSSAIVATDSFQADNCPPSVSTASVTSLTVRTETLPSAKYSSSKKRSSSKERRRSHKKHKESKKSHKRSKSESKSRSKKKKRRIRSSSNTDSE